MLIQSIARSVRSSHRRKIVDVRPTSLAKSQLPASLLFPTRSSPPLPTAWTTPTAYAKRWHGGPHVASDAPTVHITFVLPDGETKIQADARVGESLLQTTKRNDHIDLEGACEGVCACSTCHLILPQDIFDSLDEASEEEEDMLDMAYGT